MRRKRHQTWFANRIEGFGIEPAASAEDIGVPIRQPWSSTFMLYRAHHLPGIRIFVVDDRVLEGPEEILLETKMGQFFLFQKVHGQLP
jgi:hypothetical protein